MVVELWNECECESEDMGTTDAVTNYCCCIRDTRYFSYVVRVVLATNEILLI